MTTKTNVRQRGIRNMAYARVDDNAYLDLSLNQEGNYNNVDLVFSRDTDCIIIQRGDFNDVRIDNVGKMGIKIIRQEGNHNEITSLGTTSTEILQLGDNNKARSFGRGASVDKAFHRIHQIGFNNTADIVYISGADIMDRREITQVGNSNLAAMDVDGDFGGTSTITQQGNANVAFINASGPSVMYGNTTAINQMGNNNVADVELGGNNNTFTLNQLGDRNVYSGVITGSGSTVVINQP